MDPDPASRETVPPAVEFVEEAHVPADEIVTIAPAAYRPLEGPTVVTGRRVPVVGLLILSGVAVLFAAVWFMFTARSVEIVISPPPDDVSVRGGLVVPVGPRYLARPGTYELRAALEGYEPLATEIEITDERSQTIQQVLQRLPDRLTVRTPGVEDATVTVGEEAAGVAPLEDYPVPAGRHRLRVAAPLYVPHEQDLDVEGGGNPVLVELTLTPDWATVTLTSEPEGAVVLADTVEVGVTPLEFRLASGSHEIVLRKEGFKPWTQQVDLVADVPLTLPPVTLSPADGRLRVQTSPAGASVLLNGQFRGRSPLTLALPPEKTHRVRVTLAGHETADRRVALDSGQERTERITLKPVTGLVEFSVQPADAELIVDGRSRGPAPRSLEMLAVPHRLEFRKAGHASRTVSVTPTPGIPQQVSIRLLTEAEARLAAIPARIRTPQGAELIRVAGGKFRMGSERREPGRRANEGLRDVELTSPFYIGVRPVTNREFHEFMSRHSSGTAVGFGLDGDDYPAVRVTWQDAAAYCNWLSDKEGLPPAYVEKEGRLVPVRPLSAGYRMPTEAEWSWVARYAARAQTPPRYPWGNAMPPPPGAGNFADLSARGGLREVLTAYNDDYPATSPVGTFRSNSLGLFDLGGNIAEWTNDLYRAYTGLPGAPELDPLGPEEGRYYVIRGSSWAHSSITDLRLAARDYGDEARPDLGFRLARSIN